VYSPDYERQRTNRFPVLYLRHGSGDLETRWSRVGRAGVILDSLLAQHKAVPMMSVMLNGYPSLMGSGRDDAGIEAVGRETLVDIVTFIDAHYRTKPTAQNRAIAGLSRGAGQAFVAGMNHPEVFSAVGAFSWAIFECRV